jgi:hypothetical protein
MNMKLFAVLMVSAILSASAPAHAGGWSANRFLNPIRMPPPKCGCFGCPRPKPLDEVVKAAAAVAAATVKAADDPH